MKALVDPSERSARNPLKIKEGFTAIWLDLFSSFTDEIKTKESATMLFCNFMVVPHQDSLVPEEKRQKIEKVAANSVKNIRGIIMTARNFIFG